MAPGDLVPGPNTNESSTPSESAGAQMFHGAERFAIHGGDFHAGNRLTINNSFNIYPATVSAEDLARLADNVASTVSTISLSEIESGRQDHDNAGDSRSEQQGSPSSSAPITVLQWPQNMNLLNPDLHERVVSIFCESLLIAKRGFPIWTPVPSQELPISYRRKGVSIGDLGFITETGAFEYLCNVTLPITHPDNPPNIPPDLFSPSLPLSPEEIRTVKVNNPFKNFVSAGVPVAYSEDGSGISFKGSTTSAGGGGIIALPRGFRGFDISNKDSFQQYFLKNALNWYGYLITCIGSRARNGNLCLVTGCDRCRACGLAAFGSGDIDFFFGRGPEVEEIPTFRWKHMYGTSYQEHKSHPEPEDIQELRGDEVSEQERIYENLCIFVRVMNVRVREDVWAKFQSASDSQYVPNSSSENAVPGGGGASSKAEKSGGHHHGTAESTKLYQVLNTPSNTINEYLLRMEPTAEMAITSDDQWIDVLKEDDSQLPGSEELLERISNKYTIELEGGVAFLKKKASDLEPATQNLLLDTSTSQPKASAVEGNSNEEDSPHFSRRVDAPNISTVFLKDGGHRGGELVDSPDSDTPTLVSEELSASRSSAGSFQSLGTRAKPDSRAFNAGIINSRTGTDDTMREPPLRRERGKNDPGRTRRGKS